VRTIVLANHKGGCAKTTTVHNLAVLMASQGARVLAIDLDPQGNLSVGLGVNLQELEATKRTSHRLMLDKVGDFAAYLVRVRSKLDLIPACLDHEAETLIEGTTVSRDLLLKTRLRDVGKFYDYCLIDTPPALRAPTLNALACADITMIPIESSLYAMVGLNQLMRLLADVRNAYAPKMTVLALSTMYSARQTVDRDLRGQLGGLFKSNLLQTTIPRAAIVNASSLARRAVHESNIASPVSLAFFELANEIRRWCGHAHIEPEAVAGGGTEESRSNPKSHTAAD
jgi:chromosome partitioning protein